MLPVEIKKDIYWIGVVDYASKDFHGYSVSPHGTTYNSYLIKDGKNVLFDSVKAEYTDRFINSLKKVINPEDIDYIVVNHAELDHSGALGELVKLCKPEKIICSFMGEKTLAKHFNTKDWPVQAFKTGESISIGKRSIEFIEARMLHWPDSMFSYIKEDKLIITNDAFGQNIASSERFSDEIPRHLMEHAMNEYYHNIILPFSPRVKEVLKLLEEKNADIDMIAPDHGVIIRGADEVKYVLNLYGEYAEQKTKKRAVVLYDTMWESTHKMADAIAEGLQAAGIPVRIMHLKQHHHSMVMSEIAHCGLVVIGSPTHNNGVLPKVASILTYIKGLKPKNRIGAAFGSYGWSGEAAAHIHAELGSMGLDMPLEPLKAQYVPDDEMLEQCVQMGTELGRALEIKAKA